MKVGTFVSIKTGSKGGYQIFTECLIISIATTPEGEDLVELLCLPRNGGFKYTVRNTRECAVKDIRIVHEPLIGFIVTHNEKNGCVVKDTPAPGKRFVTIQFEDGSQATDIPAHTLMFRIQPVKNISSYMSNV